MSDDLKRIDIDLKQSQQEERLRRMEERATERINEIQNQYTQDEIAAMTRNVEEFNTHVDGTVDAHMRQVVRSKHVYVFPLVMSLLFVSALALILYWLYGRKEKETPVKRVPDDVVAQINDWKLTERDIDDLIHELTTFSQPTLHYVCLSRFRKSFIDDIVLTELLFTMALAENIGVPEGTAPDQEAASLSSINPESVMGIMFIKKYAERMNAGRIPFSGYAQSFFYLLCIAYRKDEFYLSVIRRKIVLINKLIAAAGTEESLTKKIDDFIGSLKVYQAGPNQMS